jgi:hypothetical protein
MPQRLEATLAARLDAARATVAGVVAIATMNCGSRSEFDQTRDCHSAHVGGSTAGSTGGGGAKASGGMPATGGTKATGGTLTVGAAAGAANRVSMIVSSRHHCRWRKFQLRLAAGRSPMLG